MALPGPGLATEKTLRIGLDNYMPYSGVDEVGHKGFVIDLVELVLSAQDISYRFEYRPWSRLLQEYADSQLDCMTVGIQADFEVAGQRNAMEPIGRFVAAFVARKGEAEGLTSLDQLRQGTWRIGFVKDFAYTENLMGFIARIPESRRVMITSNNSQRVLIRMLAARRFDFYIDDELAARHAAKELGQSDALEIFMTQSDPSLDYFIGCHDADLQETINAGVRQAKADGTLDKLILRYVD